MSSLQPSSLSIRTLHSNDLPEILRVEEESYGDLHESAAVHRNKIELFPEGVFGCFEAKKLCGYVFCLPWSGDAVFPLNKTMDCLPPDPDTLYIHDLAISPSARGKGISRLLMKEVFSLAERIGLHRFALISVQNSENFWKGFGFEAIQALDYFPGVPATRMVRKIAKGK